MDEHGGIGDGGLHVVHGGDHLRGDGEVLLGLGEGVCQGADDVDKAGKESAIKIHHAKQSLDVDLGGGEGEHLDGVDLLREGADPLGVHGVTQEGHGGLGQHALLEVTVRQFSLSLVNTSLRCCSCSSRNHKPTKMSSM